MIKISVLVAVCVILAYYSEMRTKETHTQGRHYSVWSDPAYLVLTVALVLFAGLRTGYNDTVNYIGGFQKAPILAEFFADKENLNPFKNPLFYFFESLLKTLNVSPQVLIFTTSAFTQACFLLFFKRYSRNFTFSVFIYFALGTFSVSLGALKQVLAMAVLTLAFPYLERKQWIRYGVVVFIAMLIHTYAVCFAVLPLFVRRPWKLFTYVFVIAMVALMMNFREVIREFMDQANELGKTLEDYEVFDSNTVNIFRLAVYIVTPLISLVFQKWIFHDSSTADHILAHMSIISLAFMCMGTQSGANMFARMAHYFELGTICCLPRMLENTFEQRSYRLVSAVAALCFLGFFIYANGINGSFDAQYRAVDLFAFLNS